MNTSITLFFLMGSLVMLAAPFVNLQIFSNVMALEENSYNNYDNSDNSHYSKEYKDYNDNYIANSSQPYTYENGYGYNNGYGYSNGYGYNDGYGYNEKNTAPQIFPSNKVSELGDRWWQWISGIDSTVVNPFTDLGQDGCDIGLQDNDRLLFLVGSTKDNETGFPEHECGIPQGTSILFPIVNILCDNLEGPPFFGHNETDQRICANNLVDKAFDLHAEIDGYEVKNLEQYRIDSPAGGFNFTAVENNPVLIPPGNGTGVSDGYWILLKPLKPGEHTIIFSGKINFTGVTQPGFIFEAGATYFLDVQSNEKSYYPEANEKSYYPEANEKSYYPEANEKSYYPEANEKSYYPEANEKSYYPEANEKSYYPEANEKSYYPEANEKSYYPEEYRQDNPKY